MGSVCAIVGAGEGLGSALAAKFCAEGHDIALISRTETGSAAATMAARKARPGAKIAFFGADATDPPALENAMDAAQREMGDIDVLIYNARGSFARCAPMEMSYQDLNDVYQLEVVGAFAAAKSVLPTMRQRGSGTIFFSSATAAFRGSANYPLYSIGKFGLRALSQSLTKAYARDGVHVVHVRLDCDLNVPVMREIYGDKFDASQMANTADVAQSYWLTHLQPRSAWSNEIELRPYTESWTY